MSSFSAVLDLFVKKAYAWPDGPPQDAPKCSCNISGPNTFGKKVDGIFLDAYDQYRYAFLELGRLVEGLLSK